MSNNDPTGSLDEQLHLTVVQAIHRAQEKVRWKVGKAAQHLSKRVSLGHLPPNTTQAEYEAIIFTILNDANAEVHIFTYGEHIYPTIVSELDDRVWLVMVASDGIMETAFPPDDPEEYLANPDFEQLGTLKDFQDA